MSDHRIKYAQGLFLDTREGAHCFYGVSSFQLVHEDGTEEPFCGFEGHGYTRREARRAFWNEWNAYCKQSFGRTITLHKKMRGDGSFDLVI